jgi:hypothetical protein
MFAVNRTANVPGRIIFLTEYVCVCVCARARTCMRMHVRTHYISLFECSFLNEAAIETIIFNF